MKKIALIFFILGVNFSFSQSQPSEKETFKFIAHYIKNEVIDDLKTNSKLQNVKVDIEKLKIDYENSWIQVSGSPYAFKVTEKEIIDFNKIESVSIKYSDWSNFPNSNSFWSVNVTFKKDAIKRYIPKDGVYENMKYKDIRWDDGEYKIVYLSAASFIFRKDNEEKAKRLLKAFEHLIKLKTGVDVNLFKN